MASRLVPASVTIFKTDFETFALTEPEVITLTAEPLTLDSTSDLWKASMMGPNNQPLPETNIQIASPSEEQDGHQILFPSGTSHVKVVINMKYMNRQQIASYRLQDGDLLQVYCALEPEGGDEGQWIGPLVMQYRARYAPAPAVEASTSITLDELPDEILRAIFAHLPVNETLHNIPAVCTTFLRAVQEKMPFHRWEVTNGWMTDQEVMFCQRWNSKRVTSLVMSNVVVRSFPESVAVCGFLTRSMVESTTTITSIEFHFRPGPPGQEEEDYRDGKATTYPEYIFAFSDFPGLRSLKITGFPRMPLVRKNLENFPSLERLWLHFNGQLGYDQDALIGPLIPTLKSFVVCFSSNDQFQATQFGHITMLWHHDYFGNLPMTQPCGIEQFFAAFAPGSQNAAQQRVYILHSNSTDSSRIDTMLAPLHRLNALSLTLDGHLGLEQARRWITAIPMSVTVLNLATENLDDDMCQLVADQCPRLEMFACNGSGLTELGVLRLVRACRWLKRLYLLQKGPNESLLPRTDILPEHFAKVVNDFDAQLADIFD